MPLYTAEALVLRTYKLGEADRIVVFLTRDRGKKRGVAPNARKSRRRFGAALEPLTEVRIAYFEKERRELVSLNYAEPVRSPLMAASPEALGYSHYFAELIDEWAAEADADERLFRLGTSALEALVGGAPPEALARYFECWLLRLQGVYPADLSARRAAVAHATYSPEVRHPVEVGADQEEHLVKWLSKRLGTQLRAPKLESVGYSLVGGRLLPGERGPVAHFMYQCNRGTRVTLYVRGDMGSNRSTAFRYALEGNVGVFYWVDGKSGYAISSGDISKEDLLNVANAAYQQLNPP